MYKIVMVVLLAAAVTHASNNSPRFSGSCLTAEEEKSREVVLAIRAERDRLQEEKNRLEREKQQLQATIQVLQKELQYAKKPYTSKQVDQ